MHQPSAPTPEGINAIVADINNTPGLGAGGAVKAALDPSGKYLTLTANTTDVSFNVLASAAATTLGVSGQTGNSTNLLQAVAGLSGTNLTVQANGGSAKTISFGNGGAQVSTFVGIASGARGHGCFGSADAERSGAEYYAQRCRDA